jgi:hypothetical protein
VSTKPKGVVTRAICEISTNQSSWASRCDGPCCSMQSFERSLEPLDLDPGADLKLPRELVDEISGDGMVLRGGPREALQGEVLYQ